jgi:hypothetical protein
VRPADQGPGVGGGLAWAQRLGKDCWVRDDPNVCEQGGPKQIQEVWAGSQLLDKLNGLRARPVPARRCSGLGSLPDPSPFTLTS